MHRPGVELAVSNSLSRSLTTTTPSHLATAGAAGSVVNYRRPWVPKCPIRESHGVTMMAHLLPNYGRATLVLGRITKRTDHNVAPHPVARMTHCYLSVRLSSACIEANKYECRNNKLWCESTTNPAPVLRIARFLGIDQTCNQVVPLSLHTFPGNFIQIGPAVCS